MIRQKLLIISFVIVALVGVLHLIAIQLYFYWTIHYFDSILHFLAGGAVGLASLWWILRNKTTLTSKEIFVTTFLGAIIVGVIWEIFELKTGITTLSDGIHYVTDTASDLVMDILGGFVSALYARQLFLKTNNNE